MADKTFLCGGCNAIVSLSALDSQDKCPYCGSIELEFIDDTGAGNIPWAFTELGPEEPGADLPRYDGMVWSL